MTPEEMRALDEWIYEVLMESGCAHHWKSINKRKCKCHKCGLTSWNGDANSIPEYTSTPKYAMDVLEKCLSAGHEMVLSKQPAFTRYYAEKLERGTMCDDTETKLLGQAETLPLAICLFAANLFKKEPK